MTRAFIFLAAALWACSGDDDKDKDAGTDGGGGDVDADTAQTTGSCGTTAPVVSGVVATSETEPNLQENFEVSVDDADGDLHYFDIDFWHDDVIDGAVDTSGAPAIAYSSSYGSACSVNYIVWNVYREVDGDPLPLGAELELAVVVTDAAGVASEPFVFTATMPN